MSNLDLLKLEKKYIVISPGDTAKVKLNWQKNLWYLNPQDLLSGILFKYT